jgi:hypothetical protein
MRSADPYLAEREMNLRVQSQLSEAQLRGLAVSGAGRQPGALARGGRELLCDLGYLLVSLGARLESYALAQEG